MRLRLSANVSLLTSQPLWQNSNNNNTWSVFEAGRTFSLASLLLQGRKKNSIKYQITGLLLAPSPSKLSRLPLSSTLLLFTCNCRSEGTLVHPVFPAVCCAFIITSLLFPPCRAAFSAAHTAKGLPSSVYLFWKFSLLAASRLKVRGGGNPAFPPPRAH